MRNEVNFLPANKQNFHKFIVYSISLGVHSQAWQNTLNNKFTISLQYLKENMKDEVYFLPVDKCQRFLQSHAMILDLCHQACPNYPK